MKKIILLATIIVSQLHFAQVTVEKNKLVKGGVKYKFSQFEEVFQKNDAKTYFKKARTNSTIANIFGGIGGGCIGFGLARALSGGDKTHYIDGVAHKTETKGWGLVGIGAGIVGVGIPFVLSASKNAKKAIEIENGENLGFQPYFKVESAGNGFALSYNF